VDEGQQQTEAGLAASPGGRADGDEFDVIVCGAGSAGSTVAGIFAADEDLRALLVEAGPDDADELVSDPDRWFENLGSERAWGFVTAPGGRVPEAGGQRSLGLSRSADQPATER
jgi:choline dehydrogenase